MKKSQKGFGLVPILLILILVSMVGFIGYYVYNQQTNNKTDKSEAAGDAISKLMPTPTASTKITATATVAPTSAPNNVLIIPELGLKLDYGKGPYNDIKYAIIQDGMVAAIYSQQLFDKQVAAAKKAGMSVGDTNDSKFSCNRAVYAYYQKWTGMGMDGYDMISPVDKPKDATLFIGAIGPCDPGPGLADEYSSFSNWVKNNLKQ